MSTYANITMQEVARRLARYVGVTSFLPQPYGSELEDVTYGLLGDIAFSISCALQEIASEGPLEAREMPGGGLLNAPTSITLSATNGSLTISAISPWSAWMQGCTVRIFGDGQDNELLSQTSLARPFMGSTGTLIQSTVYGDCITLDNKTGKIANPCWIANRWPLIGATNREDFMRIGQFPMVTFSAGGGCGTWGVGAAGWPYAFFYQKTVGLPRAWFVDAAYDATLGYTQRRIRVAPMPDQAYPLAYTAGINPPRITVDDILSPAYQASATVTVSGITGTTAGNQTYAYFTNLGPQAVYRGVTTATWFIYPSFGLTGNYILAASASFGATPAAYWAAGTNIIPSPSANWTPMGAATGVALVTPNFTSLDTSDPGTVVPIPNAWVESILFPIALKHFSATPLFKNEQLRPEIKFKYESALAELRNSKGQEAPSMAHYV